MRLNAQTDYALRIMMYLAAKRGDSATIQEAATNLGLSQTHLMRIAAKLSAKGFVTATRGRSGGLTLARKPEQISVEAIVQAIEPDFNLVECFAGSSCSVQPACLLKGTLASALESFFAELRAVSLADLTRPNEARLANVFKLEISGHLRGRRPAVIQTPAGGAF